MMKPACSPIGTPCRPGGLALTDRALCLCAFPSGSRLLDVACGSGDSVAHIRTHYPFDIVGVDQDPAFVDEVKRVSCARAEELPFSNHAMDGILLECCLSVMGSPNTVGRVLQECRRILKPQGRLIVSDLYARGIPASFGGCLGNVETRQAVESRLSENGFLLDLFEDHSECLLAAWAQMIMGGQTVNSFNLIGDDLMKLKAAQCGYYLIVARKGVD